MLKYLYGVVYNDIFIINKMNDNYNDYNVFQIYE